MAHRDVEADREFDERRIERNEPPATLADVAAKVTESLPEERIESVLEEAMRLTAEDRQGAYGPPRDNIGQTAALWSAYTGRHFTAREVAVCMVLVKISRDSYKPKRDNLTDMAGWARVAEMVGDDE